MARPKRMGLISVLTKMDQLLENASALEPRVARIEKVLFGSPIAGRRGRKPGRPRKMGRPGKMGRPRKRGRKAGAQKACTIPGCSRKHYAKGLCANHYQASRRKKGPGSKAGK